MAERVPEPQDDEPTIGRLVGDLSRDVSTLISKEIELAKSEITFSVKAGGIGAALFAVAGFLLLLAVIILSGAIAYFIHMTGLDLAWCFLIVFFAYVLVAAVLALIGLRKFKQVKAPEATMEQLTETKNVLTRKNKKKAVKA